MRTSDSILILGAACLALAACKDPAAAPGAVQSLATARTQRASTPEIASASANIVLRTPVIINARITVDRTKPNGDPWDGAGDPPDIALCATTNGTTHCYPEGTDPNSVPRAECQNSHECNFSNVMISAGTLSLRVIDVDAFADDLIGEGACEIGTRCRIGRAVISTEDIRAVAARERRAREEAEARFHAMSPAEHVAAAQAALAEGYDEAEHVGGNVEEAQRHLAEIPRSAPERRSANALTREIAARERRTRALAARLAREMRARAQQAREEIAQEIDGNLVRRGTEVNSVHAVGPERTTLRINYALCGRVFVHQFASGNRGDLLRAGFRRVECTSYFQRAWEDLQ